MVTSNKSVRQSFKRLNPLMGEWVIFAPVTAVRPWSGTLVSATDNKLPEFDPTCYLCPGMKRSNGKVNPYYSDVHVFDNDFPSFSMDYSMYKENKTHMMNIPARGICRVVCFNPKHNITLAEMDCKEILKVICTLRDQFLELSSIPDIKNVMLFENKGTVIGVSNPHPHGQIYATDFVPKIIFTHYSQSREFMENNKMCLFCSILEEELKNGRRLICENDDFVAYVPYFARYTYEVHLISRRHIPDMSELTENELLSLADIYLEVLIRFDNLFETPFPNITIFRNASCSEEIEPELYHFYIEFCPPLRSRDKLKYMAGFETGGGNIINPSLPCESAKALRSVSALHYTKRSS